MQTPACYTGSFLTTPRLLCQTLPGYHSPQHSRRQYGCLYTHFISALVLFSLQQNPTLPFIANCKGSSQLLQSYSPAPHTGIHVSWINQSHLSHGFAHLSLCPLAPNYTLGSLRTEPSSSLPVSLDHSTGPVTEQGSKNYKLTIYDSLSFLLLPCGLKHNKAGSIPSESMARGAPATESSKVAATAYPAA